MELTFDLEPGDDLVYVAEAAEQIERIEGGLLELESDAGDEGTLAEIFRAAHTLKGSAATIGHGRMAELTHALEEVFGALRSGLLADLGSFDDLLLPAVDVLRLLVDEVAAGHTLTDAPGPLARSIIDRLRVALAAAPSGDIQPNESDVVAVATVDARTLARLLGEAPPADGARSVVSLVVDADSAWVAVRLLQGLMAATESGRLLASVPSLEEIEAGSGNAIVSMLLRGNPAELDGLLGRLRAMDDTVLVEVHELDDETKAASLEPADSREEPLARRSAANTIRIDVGQLDDLMNLVGELIVQKTRLRRQAGQLAARLGEEALATEAEDGYRQFAQIVDRLQAGVTSLRMMPIETVFSRFPRLVRDLSAQLGKDVVLALEGGDTELDRSLIEQVGDPITHLIRNALDHGLELGPERIAAGKPGRGTIRVAARHAEGRVIVEVEDDGRGMDPRAIAQAAVKRGLIEPGAIVGMTDAEAIRLVFVPGFSTASEITSISGRGVGMDVVLTNVERLGGQVSVDSTLGSGTTISMSLPLTLAIIEALLVRSGERVCAIPLRSVIETQRVPRTDVRTVASQPVLSLPQGVVPLRSLDQAMGEAAGDREADGYVRAVLVRSRGSVLALGVDEFLGTEEIVLKSLGLPGDQPIGVVGATILADGGVALVVDVDRLSDTDRVRLRSA